MRHRITKASPSCATTESEESLKHARSARGRRPTRGYYVKRPLTLSRKPVPSRQITATCWDSSSAMTSVSGFAGSRIAQSGVVSG
jgi:hypothetical protein